MKNRSIVQLLAVCLVAGGTLDCALAGTATGSFDFNTIVQANDTQSSWTNQVVVNDPESSATATLDFVLSLSGGGNFKKLDSNTRVGGSGGSDINSLDSAEAVTLTVSLVSATAGKDVAVNTTHFGLRDGWAASSSSWSSSATAGPVVISLPGSAGDKDYALDGASDFSSINSADYVGTFDTTSGFVHLSDTGTANGISYSVLFFPPSGTVIIIM